MLDVHTAVQAAKPPQMKPSAVESVTAGLDVLIRVYDAGAQPEKQRAYTVTVRGNSNLKCTGTHWQERVGLTRLFTVMASDMMTTFNFK